VLPVFCLLVSVYLFAAPCVRIKIIINDMPDIIEKFAQVSLFADDAKISKHIANNEDCRRP